MALLPHGYSWPTLHWWLSLSAVEQGAWASGVGTAFAAVVALGVAFLPRLELGRKRASRRRLVASLIYSEIEKARNECNHAWMSLKQSLGDGEIRQGMYSLLSIPMEPLAACEHLALELDCFDAAEYNALLRAMSEYPIVARRVRRCASASKVNAYEGSENLEQIEAHLLLADLERVGIHLKTAAAAIKSFSALDYTGQDESTSKALFAMVGARKRDAQQPRPSVPQQSS